MAGPLVVAVSAHGTKARIDELPEEAWRIIAGPDRGGEDSPGALYGVVSVLYRCATLRADAVAGMPWALVPLAGDGQDVEDPIAVLPWLKGFKGALREAELSQVVHGRSYLLKIQNRYRYLKGLQKLYPPLVEPQYDQQTGELLSFTRRLPGRVEPVPLKLTDLVYVWQPNPNSENAPGPAPAAVALAPAGVLRNVDRYAGGFFDRGAINTTILSVEGNPDPGELRRLENWWKRLLRGVKSAFETVAVRAAVKPVVVGSPPKDLAMSDITERKREDVALALGVPMSLLFAKAANFATAHQDKLNFYDQTIVPECRFFEEILNDQLFAPLGYRFEFRERQLEVYQEAETQKAFGLVASAQAGLITRQEWRSVMDYPEQPEGEFLTAAPDVLHGSDPKARGQVAADNGAAVLPPSVTPAKAADLARWQRKALKALKDGKGAGVSFESDHLAPAETRAIVDALAVAEDAAAVKAAFREVAALPGPFRHEEGGVYP